MAQAQIQDDIVTLPGETIYQRISKADGQVLQKCFDMCQKYGKDEPFNRAELAQMLAEICLQNGDKAFADLADLHPDKDFILANQPATPIVTTTPSLNDTGRQFNCTGCSGNCGQKMINDGGTASASAPAVMPAPGTPSSTPMDGSLTNALILSVYAIIAVGALSLFMVVAINLIHKHE